MKLKQIALSPITETINYRRYDEPYVFIPGLFRQIAVKSAPMSLPGLLSRSETLTISYPDDGGGSITVRGKLGFKRQVLYRDSLSADAIPGEFAFRRINRLGAAVAAFTALTVPGSLLDLVGAPDWAKYSLFALTIYSYASNLAEIVAFRKGLE
jgi:hypothetical protein